VASTCLSRARRSNHVCWSPWWCSFRRQARQQCTPRTHRGACTTHPFRPGCCSPGYRTSCGRASCRVPGHTQGGDNPPRCTHPSRCARGRAPPFVPCWSSLTPCTAPFRRAPDRAHCRVRQRYTRLYDKPCHRVCCRTASAWKARWLCIQASHKVRPPRAFCTALVCCLPWWCSFRRQALLPCLAAEARQQCTPRMHHALRTSHLFPLGVGSRGSCTA
jgi:hypothetical protein